MSVTVCKEVGERIPPGADHKQRFMEYAMSPGEAWRIEASGKPTVVPIRQAEKGKFLWALGWIDGRTVALFQGPDGREYAQPTDEAPRARRRGREEAPRREAPGVAPEVRVQEDPEPVRAPPTPLTPRKARTLIPL